MSRTLSAEEIHDLIYYSAVPAWFAPVEGQATSSPTSLDKWFHKRSNTDRSKPLSYLGPLYADYVIVNVPAEDCEPPKPAEPNSLPPELAKPLLKCRNPSGVKGLSSGVRSGLIKLQNGRWIRLKGMLLSNKQQDQN